MKKQIIGSILFFTCILFVFAIGYSIFLERAADSDERGQHLVMLNEIEQLTKAEDGSNPAAKEMEALREELKKEIGQGRKRQMEQTVVVYTVFLICYVFLLFLYIYFKILRPFYKLEKYAGEIAKGNFDTSLKYEKTNFFGAFTWAFDHMREEITQARKNEENAINENKTIIATLSHDIKTPIASIRAYAEGLEANLEADYEQRERYLAVIMKKCDEVTRLTNDLVLHSLSELERLEVNEQKINIKAVLEEILSDLEYKEIKIIKPIPEAFLMADKKRLAQVIENLLNNARKYAPGTQVDIWAAVDEGRYEIHIRDYGTGIFPEDMPFIFDKFYRGKNVENAPGSGLGLYIVKYILNKMDGDISLKNHRNGLEAIVWLPLSRKEY